MTSFRLIRGLGSPSYDFVTIDMHKWLRTLPIDNYMHNRSMRMIYFKNPEDAIIFKLKFPRVIHPIQ